MAIQFRDSDWVSVRRCAESDSVVQWASPLASAGIAPFTLEHKLVDICHALTDLGFSKIVLIHGHGGLSSGRLALWQAMQEKRPALYVDFHPYERCWDRIHREIIGQDIHGGNQMSP